jgi:proteasome lid subunit RPN8/RPN11
MALKVSKHNIQKMFDHGEESYPYECCGVLIGIPGDSAVVLDVQRLTNVNNEMPTRRYDVDPLELARADSKAEAKGLEIIGIYHSHPDHPARPSKYDLDHAWRYLSYIVMSIKNGKAKDITSWRLNEKKEFEQEELIIAEETAEVV